MTLFGRVRAICLIVRRSLRQHAVSTVVTTTSAALASGLVMAVFAVSAQTYDAFTGGPVGFDAVLGARGSALQLVLNTVFHLETSPGNIPWAMYEDVRTRPEVEIAIPYAVGDNYYGYRIVGTTDELFTRFEYQQGRKLTPLPGGRIFDPTRREAVIGHTVARKTGLKVGDVFNPYHGIAYNPAERHPQEYVVVGVLAPSNSPSDRVIWIPIEGIFRMENHVLRGTGEDFVPASGVEIPDEHKEVSAVMLKLRGAKAGFSLAGEVNTGKAATLAWPIAKEMADLFQKMGWVNRILELVAYLVLLVAAASILASIYNTMNERRREFAILRSLGARRRTVLAAIVLESGTIAAMGSVAGFLVYGLIMAGTGWMVERETGVVMDPWALHPVLALAPAGMTLLGMVAGIAPALKAYATDVAAHLVPHS